MKTIYDKNQLSATLDDQGVCTVTLNNPPQLNALNTTMAAGSLELSQIISASSARVVVFTGAGRAFSAGGDLAYLIELTKLPAAESQAAMLHFYKSYLSLFTIPLPTIAHINGACVGAGFCLALACDLRFIVSGAKIGMNFVRIGLNPGMAAEYWARTLASPLAKEMLYTGKIFSSSEPRLRPLFNAVASEAEIAALVADTARSIAMNSPQSVKISVGLLRNTDLDLEATMQAEAHGQGICMSTGEIAASVEAQRAGKEFRFKI
ncbi:MAG: enoyl-CoA hydratase/isomerase family protein [Turneriella sp.]